MEQIKAPAGANRKKTIVGRGNGSKGRSSGRGHDGQNSRSGGGVRPGFEGGQMPLYRRIARKGFSNHPFKKNYVVFNLSELNERFDDGETVSIDTLRAKKMVKGKKYLVKILGDGDLKKKLTVSIDKISVKAKEKIEKAGGKILVEEGSDGK